jgi:hypothetical protein
MTTRLEVLITFLLYLVFFAWIGWRRGWRAELNVFATAFLAWLALQREGDIFVRLANLGGKMIAFVRAGGLGANPDPAFVAVREAPLWVTEESRPGYLFLVWVLIVLIAYIVSSSVQFRTRKSERTEGWAVLLGMANGLLFAATFLPRLVALVAPEGADFSQLAQRVNLIGILTSSVRLLMENLALIWATLRPQSSIILLILLTLFLVLVATTLKGSSKEDKSDGAKAKS